MSQGAANYTNAQCFLYSCKCAGKEDDSLLRIAFVKQYNS
jgi:hypothetical protein